uniref:superoxide dismutase n=1 Tax=Kalanchoe fedtschenkoi TaxID=63787 RepID=A0A7N0TDH3_KALFE
MATVKAVALIAGDDDVRGSVQFLQDPKGVIHVKGRISGLKPGLHGFHIHALGDTTNGCISTGPHYNPLKQPHGAPSDTQRHAGDLGNIVAGPDGVADISIEDRQVI